METRSSMKRLKKRITVRFGEAQPEKVAFTEDLSRSGLFVKTSNVISPGKPVRVAFELDQGVVLLEGKVVWAKKVPPAMLRVAKKCGMGIRITRILEGEQAYLALFPEAA